MTDHDDERTHNMKQIISVQNMAPRNFPVPLLQVSTQSVMYLSRKDAVC